MHDSLNHYSYGAISGWLLSGVAGIDYDFKHIVIKPVPHKSLGFVRASYDSPKGLIISEWQYESDTDSFSYHIVVPDGVNATIKLPDGRCEEVCGGDYKY